VGSVCGFVADRTSTPRRREGIDFTTLTLTAVASGAAAYTCSKLWAPGALPSAAATPVLVALIREGLQRPTEAVTRAVPVRGVVRSADPPATDPPGNRVPAHWRLAIVTGLLGFLIAAVVLTVPELVSGGSAGGGGRQTTLFGGEKHKQTTREPAPTSTTPGTTVTTPAKTVTVPPATTTAPTPTTTTPPPTQTSPPPATTAPAPPAPGQP
jgi:hypothetical protein